MRDEALPPVLTDTDIYERMVSAVLDHRLAPGTKLVEDKLAQAFGVSRTRIRPVLVRLASEQIVTLTPNRGATIAQPTEQEAIEVFGARQLIEPVLVERFVRYASLHDIQRLRDCLLAEEQARAAGDIRRAIRLSGDFHLRIAEHAQHQTFGRILRELVSRTSLILMTYSAPHARERDEATACGCREHHSLVDAIWLRDGPEAARQMQGHLARLQSQLNFTPATNSTPDLSKLFGQSTATLGP